MALMSSQLSLPEQLKLIKLNKADREKVLNCKSSEEASIMLANMKESVRLPLGKYSPKLHVSGSSVKYVTKNLFTEVFDETDVKDFMSLAEMSAMLEDEVIIGELKRKIHSIEKDGKQPLQCLVYATKQNEKVFYNNEKKVSVWAQVIADTVNNNPDYALSINHMLVNWGMWKYQIIMLITACGRMRQNEKLDEVIRDLYTDYEDDKVRFTVMKRLLHGLNKANYRCALTMLKNTDFIGSDMGRKYFNALKRKIENSNLEERTALFEVFRGIQGFSSIKKKRIEKLFLEEDEPDLAKKINESSHEQKAAILEMVHKKINGSQYDCREISKQAKNIKQYRSEIQKMFMQKFDKKAITNEEIKIHGLAIGELDQEGKAIPFLENQMSLYFDEETRLMFSYVLAVLSDAHIDSFIDNMLKYEGNRSQVVLNSVRNLIRPGKNQFVRQYLYENCLKIKEQKGTDSKEFKNALRNMGVFLQSGVTVAVYDLKFDQMLFEFVGYNKTDGTIEASKCTARNTALVLGILEAVMDKSNYEGRYMNFMWDLFAHFKNKNIDLRNRIDDAVKHLTGQGIPSI